MNNQQLFGLIAFGNLERLDGRGQIMCKYLFLTEEEAKNYIPEFIPKCITPLNDWDLRVLSENDLECEVMKFELRGELGASNAKEN